jgi:transcription initiation factor TFIID subunit 1
MKRAVWRGKKSTRSLDLIQEIFETVEASSEYLTTVIGTLEVPTASDEPGVTHNENALDYSDFQELAEDLLPMPLPPQLPIRPVVPIPDAPSSNINISEIFPGFQKGKRLRFCELFTAKVPKSYNVYRLEQKKPTKQDFYPLKASELALFNKAMAARYSSEEKTTESPTIEIKINIPELEVEETLLGVKDSTSLHPIVLDAWEKNIIWDSTNDRIRSDKAPAITLDKTAMFRNTHLENEKWLESIAWEMDKMGQKMEFHMDDPTIVILQSEAQEIKSIRL